MFLKNRNIISKIKRSKVTDYAALKLIWNASYTDLFPYSYQNIIDHKLILTAIFSLSLIQLDQVVVSSIVVYTSVHIMCGSRWTRVGPFLEVHQAVGILKNTSMDPTQWKTTKLPSQHLVTDYHLVSSQHLVLAICQRNAIQMACLLEKRQNVQTMDLDPQTNWVRTCLVLSNNCTYYKNKQWDRIQQTYQHNQVHRTYLLLYHHRYRNLQNFLDFHNVLKI